MTFASSWLCAKTKQRNYVKRKLITLAIVLLIWLCGNLLHLAWIQFRYQAWNKKVARNSSGLLEHSSPFSLGSGKTALIFIHGFADLPYGWTRIAEQLSANPEFCCHTLRVPHWGEPLSEQRKARMDEIRNVIDGKICELESEHKNIWLVGHSMGCAFAIDAIPRNVDKITGLVALAPLIRVSNKRVPFLTARFWYHLGTKVLWLAKTFESPFTEKITAADDPDFTYAVDKFIPYKVYDILFSVTKSNQKVIIPASMPVFCAVSTNDKVIDTDSAKQWFNGLQGEKKLYIDTVAAHALHVGENWKEITDLFGVFILENSKK